MSSGISGSDWHTRTLRAWQLAVLRFAVTLDNADRLAVFAIASEIDRLDRRHGVPRDFRFFRRTSVELCAAILQPNELTSTLLHQYLARIGDGRLRRALAAAMEVDQPKATSVNKTAGRKGHLWRGLPPLSNSLL
jgi:hypothetical protein